MTGINLVTVDGDRHVVYNGRTIKVFSKYDDWAFTRASDYADKLRKMTEDEFKEIYPEHFL